ncbi:hypothetical protein ABZP36_032406 [Zizania latifolia]
MPLVQATVDVRPTPATVINARSWPTLSETTRTKPPDSPKPPSEARAAQADTSGDSEDAALAAIAGEG